MASGARYQTLVGSATALGSPGFPDRQSSTTHPSRPHLPLLQGVKTKSPLSRPPGAQTGSRPHGAGRLRGLVVGSGSLCLVIGRGQGRKIGSASQEESPGRSEDQEGWRHSPEAPPPGQQQNSPKASEPEAVGSASQGGGGGPGSFRLPTSATVDCSSRRRSGSIHAVASLVTAMWSSDHRGAQVFGRPPLQLYWLPASGWSSGAGDRPARPLGPGGVRPGRHRWPRSGTAGRTPGRRSTRSAARGSSGSGTACRCAASGWP